MASETDATIAVSNYSQKLSGSGVQREALRVKGQFWTPEWVAEAMVAYVLAGGSEELFDPAVGAGALFRAAKSIAASLGREVALSGTEIDPDALQQAKKNGLSESDLANVQITDFLLRPPRVRLKAIVANPPYIRHHRLTSNVKASLKKYGTTLIGKPLDGRAGLHIYFLLRALDMLDEDGRLAFIMPADTCEGIFAQTLWGWITRNYRIEGVVTFSPDASPFPSVDTNPIIIMIRKVAPQKYFHWVRCDEAQTDDLKEWALSGLDEKRGNGLSICHREVEEGLATGLSRPPSNAESTDLTLADFARVMRGIATGSNEFFFLTKEQAKALKIPDEFLLPAIGRTRDVTGDEVSVDRVKSLEERGRPTLLFSPDGRPLDKFPKAVREYLKQGEAMGIDKKTLIATRRPWYKMEVRDAPPILFAYLGRRNARFIRNFAGVMPLTGFLCVYPHRDDNDFADKLWRVLQQPETISNLRLVGKSYGSGAIKVEPRALEKLPIPISVATELGLRSVIKTAQLTLW